MLGLMKFGEVWRRAEWDALIQFEEEDEEDWGWGSLFVYRQLRLGSRTCWGRSEAEGEQRGLLTGQGGREGEPRVETWTVSGHGCRHLCWRSHSRGAAALWLHPLALLRADWGGQRRRQPRGTRRQERVTSFDRRELRLPTARLSCLHLAPSNAPKPLRALLPRAKDVLASTFTQGRILLVFTATEQPAWALLQADPFPAAAEGKPAMERGASLARRVDCCSSWPFHSPVAGGCSPPRSPKRARRGQPEHAARSCSVWAGKEGIYHCVMISFVCLSCKEKVRYN